MLFQLFVCCESRCVACCHLVAPAGYGAVTSMIHLLTFAQLLNGEKS